jgi:[ribosomal protein S5]-alanine N-acetyltransferase
VSEARIELSRPGISHRDAFIEAMRASHDLHRPWAYPPETREAYDAYAARCLSDPSFEGHLALRIADGAIAGFLNVSQIVRGPMQGAFLGYAGVAGMEGQGYMREAMALVLDRVFGELGLHRIEANVQPGNEASLALIRGAGFEREGFSPRYLKIGGRWRDHERWAIRDELWHARRAG